MTMTTNTNDKAPAPAPVAVYRISRGGCEEVSYTDDNSLLAQGINPWTANDVVMLPNGRRAVFYPKGHANPWPINLAKPTDPKSLTETDLRKMYGAYMVWLAEQALRPPEAKPKLTLGEVIILIVSGVGAMLSGFALYYAWKVLDMLQHFAAGK